MLSKVHPLLIFGLFDFHNVWMSLTEVSADSLNILGDIVYNTLRYRVAVVQRVRDTVQGLTKE